MTMNDSEIRVLKVVLRPGARALDVGLYFSYHTIVTLHFFHVYIPLKDVILNALFCLFLYLKSSSPLIILLWDIAF